MCSNTEIRRFTKGAEGAHTGDHSGPVGVEGVGAERRETPASCYTRGTLTVHSRYMHTSLTRQSRVTHATLAKHSRYMHTSLTRHSRPGPSWAQTTLSQPLNPIPPPFTKRGKKKTRKSLHPPAPVLDGVLQEQGLDGEGPPRDLHHRTGVKVPAACKHEGGAWTQGRARHAEQGEGDASMMTYSAG